MNCVKCGRWSYFTLEAETCGQCHQHETDLQRLKTEYEAEKANGTFRLNWAVIHCYWRKKLSLRETAFVLGVEERTIEFEIDIARQNAT